MQIQSITRGTVALFLSPLGMRLHAKALHEDAKISLTNPSLKNNFRRLLHLNHAMQLLAIFPSLMSHGPLEPSEPDSILTVPVKLQLPDDSMQKMKIIRRQISHSSHPKLQSTYTSVLGPLTFVSASEVVYACSSRSEFVSMSKSKSMSSYIHLFHLPMHLRMSSFKMSLTL